MARTRAAIGAVVLAAAVACTPASSATPAGTASANGWEAAMLTRVNAERAAVGAAPLVACGTLRLAAQAHSLDQAAHATMTHTGSDGSSLATRAQRAGYTGWTSLGENVAAGSPTVDAAMAAWMGSSGHRANLLNTSFTHVGLGQAIGADGTPYWTQDLGTSGHC